MHKSYEAAEDSTVFNIGTVIGINASSSGYDGENNPSVPDEKKELLEIITMIENARDRLGDLLVRYDAREDDTTELDEAVDALFDATDILQDVLDEYDE